MTFVKICGITDADTLAAAHHADALGFVVNSPKSHRNLTHAQANALCRKAGPFQTAVAVTAERDVEELYKIVRDLRPAALQVPFRAGQSAFTLLHETFPMLRIIISCRPEDAHLVPDIADALVLDAATLDGYGGTGQRTDWNTAKAARQNAQVPVILAGGLTPEIVAEAIRIVEPYGVDVSSGVETEMKKDPAKIKAFITNAKRGEVA